MPRPLAVLLLSVAVMTVCSGCVAESEKGGVHTFSYELWVPASVILGSMALVVGGWFVRNRLTWTPFILGVVGVGISPMTILDNVTVGPESFSQTTGLWGMNRFHLNYANLASVKFETRQERGRRGRKVDRSYLDCTQKNGQTVAFPLNSVIAEKAFPTILTELIAHEVPIANVAVQGGE